MNNGIIGSFFAILFSLSAASLAHGQAKEEKYGNWIYKCGDNGNCLITQEILYAESQTRIGSMSVLVNDQDGTDLVFSGPLGILLPPGFIVAVDKEEPQRIPILLCDNSGCQTRQTVDEEWIALLQRGDELKLHFSSIDNKQFNIIFSLIGFSKAYSKLTAGS